jgi:protein gp37
VLTKRSERLRDLLSGKLRFASDQENIWWGVSIEESQVRASDIASSASSGEGALPLGAIGLSGINWVMVGGKKAVLELALWRRNG